MEEPLAPRRAPEKGGGGRGGTPERFQGNKDVPGAGRLAFLVKGKRSPRRPAGRPAGHPRNAAAQPDRHGLGASPRTVMRLIHRPQAAREPGSPGPAARALAPPAVPLRARGRRRHVRPLPAPSALRPGTSANRPARRALRGHESVAAAPGQPGRKGLERGPGTPAEPRRRRPAAPSGKAERVPGSLGLGAAAAATAPARSPHSAASGGGWGRAGRGGAGRGGGWGPRAGPLVTLWDSKGRNRCTHLCCAFGMSA